MEEQKQSNQGKAGIGLGLGGGFIASLCCLGPAVALVLGLGSASFLFGLTIYRPYLLSVSFLLMGAGVLLMLRRSKACCSREEHRRNLWRYPGLMLLTFAVSYVLLTYIIPSLAYRGVGVSSIPVAADGLGERRNTLSSSELQALTKSMRLAALEIKGMT